MLLTLKMRGGIIRKLEASLTNEKGGVCASYFCAGAYLFSILIIRLAFYHY